MAGSGKGAASVEWGLCRGGESVGGWLSGRRGVSGRRVQALGV